MASVMRVDALPERFDQALSQDRYKRRRYGDIWPFEAPYPVSQVERRLAEQVPTKEVRVCLFESRFNRTLSGGSHAVHNMRENRPLDIQPNDAATHDHLLDPGIRSNENPDKAIGGKPVFRLKYVKSDASIKCGLHFLWPPASACRVELVGLIQQFKGPWEFRMSGGRNRIYSDTKVQRGEKIMP